MLSLVRTRMKPADGAAVVPQLFADGLALQRLYVEVVGFSRHDEEDDHRHVVFVDLWRIPGRTLVSGH